MFLLWKQNNFKIYNINLKKLFNVKELFFLSISLIPLITFFSWRYFTLLDGDFFPVVTNMDSLKHVLRADFLVNTGVESVNVNYLNLPDGVDPYHYFEAWTIGTLGTMFNLNFWVTEQLIVFPMLSSIITIGFWGFLERWKAQWYLYLFGVLSVVFTGFYLKDFEQIPYLKYSGNYFINAFDEWKGLTVCIAYLVVMLFLTLFSNNKEKTNSFLVLLFLPILSITLAPTILSILFIISLILIVFRKKLNQESNLSLIQNTIIIALAIGAFYFAFKPTEQYISTPSLRLNELFTIPTLKHRLIIVIEKLIQGIVIFFPILLILVYFFITNFQNFRLKIQSNSNKILLLFIFIGISTSALVWQVLFYSFGASQFLFYTMLPLINLISLLILCYFLIFIKKRYSIIFSSILIPVCFFFFGFRSYNVAHDAKVFYHERYSLSYIQNVIFEVSKIKNRTGIKFEDKNDYEKYNDLEHLVGNFLPGHINNTFLFSYTKAEMFIKNDFPNGEAKMLIPKAPLVSLYVSIHGTEKNLDSLNILLVNLIRENKIKFMFGKNSNYIPDFLRPYIKSIFKDSKSKEVFITLKSLNESY